MIYRIILKLLTSSESDNVSSFRLLVFNFWYFSLSFDLGSSKINWKFRKEKF